MVTAKVSGGTTMAKSLYQQLRNIGIDDELAHNVDKALDPAREIIILGCCSAV